METNSGSDLKHSSGHRRKNVGNKAKENLPTGLPLKSAKTKNAILTKIIVKNLDGKSSEQEISSFFRKFGKVISVQKTPKCITGAFVTFGSEEEAGRVLSLPSHELIFRKKQLYVQKYDTMGSNVSAEKQSECVEEPCHINNLPTETLDYIFSFLRLKERIQTEMVCKHWRKIGKNRPWCWPTTLRLDPDHPESLLITPPLTESILSAILSRCGPSLKRLAVSRYGDEFSPTTFNVIGKYCHSLVEVKFDGLTLAHDSLKILAENCPKLRYVSLRYSSEFSDKNLLGFLKDCDRLEGLDISSFSKITGECFDALTNNIRIIRFDNCVALKTALAMEKLITRCDSLHELQLFDCPTPKFDTMLRVFRRYKYTLKVLQLRGFLSCFGEWCESISVLQNLEELVLNEYHEINDDFLEIVAKKCSKLKVLHVAATSITDDGLRYLISTPYLKILDISHIDGITGKGIKALAMEGRLEQLYCRFNSHVTDDSFSSLATCCPRFCILDVSGSIKISNRLVRIFRQSIKSHFFESVRLIVGGTSVTKDNDNCERLEVLFDGNTTLKKENKEFSDRATPTYVNL